MTRIIRVGIVQQACSNDIKANLEKLHGNIASVAQAGANLVVLQELHNTPYFCQTEDTSLFDLAEPIPGPSTGFYSEIAAAYGIVLVTSLFERRAPGLYHNTAVVFEKDGNIAGIYRKMHIPDEQLPKHRFDVIVLHVCPYFPNQWLWDKSIVLLLSVPLTGHLPDTIDPSKPVHLISRQMFQSVQNRYHQE